VIVNIYDKTGLVVDTTEINDTISYVSGRVSKSDKGVYYKGAGVPYERHLSLNPDKHVVVKEKSPVFYCGYSVVNPKWEGKTGIFQERYQPYFNDFIGSCGPKELNLISHSEEFEMSSVKVLDCVEYDKANNQRYFVVNYDCDRKRYLDDGSPTQLIELLDYMVCNNWNFPWDKTAINDISACGRVSDVADMFKSDKLRHKLGTVYSVLYSLSKLAPQKYRVFLKELGLNHNNAMDYVFITMAILERNGIDTTPMIKGNDEYDAYCSILLNYLLLGRNCAHVEDKHYGDKVKIAYVNRQKLAINKGKE
jgi:hypothetical protein